MMMMEERSREKNVIYLTTVSLSQGCRVGPEKVIDDIITQVKFAIISNQISLPESLSFLFLSKSPITLNIKWLLGISASLLMSMEKVKRRRILSQGITGCGIE